MSSLDTNIQIDSAKRTVDAKEETAVSPQLIESINTKVNQNQTNIVASESLNELGTLNKPIDVDDEKKAKHVEKEVNESINVKNEINDIISLTSSATPNSTDQQLIKRTVELITPLTSNNDNILEQNLTSQRSKSRFSLQSKITF